MGRTPRFRCRHVKFNDISGWACGRGLSQLCSQLTG